MKNLKNHQMKSIFIFPLPLILMPNQILPLKIFEQKYLFMTKNVLKIMNHLELILNILMKKTIKSLYWTPLGVQQI